MTLVTVDKHHRVLRVEAILDYPKPGVFPRENHDETITYWLLRPYYAFPLGSYLEIQEVQNANV